MKGAVANQTKGTVQRWDLRLTQQLVREVFGATQWNRAHPSVRSLADRPEFCRYHYHLATDMLDSYIASLGEHGLWGIFEDRNEFNYLMLKVRANIVAFVQSLHAVADTCAHALYYALALDAAFKPVKERDINAAEVLRRLKRQCDDGRVEFYDIHRRFRELTLGDDYAYLHALVNTLKHRAIVRPELNEDATGKREEKWILFLEPFFYDGVLYRKVNVREFMRREHDRIQALTVDIGRSVNDLLSTRLDVKAPAVCKAGRS